MIPGPGLREEVAEAARVLARLGLVTAFGHVSARAGAAMLITPAAALAGVTAAAVIEVSLATEGPLPKGAPAEAWAHLALYRVWPDAAAVARAQPAGAFAAAAAVSVMVPLRGNGALTLGAAPGLAVARMWLLAAACDVYLKALAAFGANPVTPLSAAEIASWRAVGGELLPRLWQHLRRGAEPGPHPGEVQG